MTSFNPLPEAARAKCTEAAWLTPKSLWAKPGKAGQTSSASASSGHTPPLGGGASTLQATFENRNTNSRQSSISRRMTDSATTPNAPTARGVGEQNVPITCEKGCRYLGFADAVNHCPYCELGKAGDALAGALTRAQVAEAALLAARREAEDAQRYRALRAGIGNDLRIVRFGNPPDEDVTHIDGPSGIDAFADELRAALAATREEKVNG